MPRLAVMNLFIGFSVITIAAAGGIFVAFDLTEIYIRGTDGVDAWYQVLSRSAHGHFNLFGFLHVMFGLTLAYSKFSIRVKSLQTIALALATLAMGPAMLWRASLGPTDSFDLNGVVIGIGSSCGLLALATHAAGLGIKFFDRGP